MKSLNPTTVSFANSIPLPFDGTNLLTYETAMWANDGWFGDSSANNPFISKEYPYIDYNNYYGLSEDYSVYDGSGSSFGIDYGNNIYTLSTSQTSLNYTNVKWLVFNVLWTSVTSNQKLNFTVSGSKGNSSSSQTLQWPNDYIVFYLEQDVGGSNAYTVNTGSVPFSSSYTPWLDVQNSSRSGSQRNSFQYAQSLGTSIKGSNNGANFFGSGTSGTLTSINRFRVGSPQINQYLAFGLRPGIKFTGLTITFG